MLWFNSARKLLKAAQEGDTNTVRSLLDRGINPNEKDKQGNNALMLAIDAGYVDIVRLLFEKGGVLDERHEALTNTILREQYDLAKILIEKETDFTQIPAGENALHWAVRMGKDDLVTMLLEKGIPLNEKDDNDETALMIAAREGFTDIALMLIDEGANLDKKDGYGKTVLHFATSNHATTIVKALIRHGVLLNELETQEGNTPLVEAIEKGFSDIARILIEKGADPNQPDAYGHTPLIQAATYNREATLKLLLEQELEIDAVDEDGNTALFYALQNNNQEFVQMLLDKGADIYAAIINLDTLLEDASNTDTIKLILAQRIDLDPGHAATMLINAVENEDIEMIELLIKCNIDLDGYNEDGNTALILAIDKGNDTIAEMLIDAGADVNAANGENDTPLIMAAYHNNAYITNLLLEKDADVDIQGEDGNTALIWAADNGNTRMVQALVIKGANLDKRDNEKATALMIAAAHGYSDIVKILIDHNAALDKKNEDGRTALMQAAINGFVKIAQMLLDKGAALNKQDNDGNTALMLAEDNGHPKVACILREIPTKKAQRKIIAEKKEKEKNPEEGWSLMGSGKVAFIGVYPEARRKLTEIFNFESRHLITITENLQTNAETTTPICFDDLPPTTLQKAFAQFTQLGGVADEAFVMNGSTYLDKKPLVAQLKQVK